MRKLALVCLALGGLVTAPGCETTPVGPGYFDVAWILTYEDPNNGNVTTIGCENLGVTAEVISERGGQRYVDLFDCVDGSGVTSELPSGNYTVWVNILDAGNALVAQSNAQDVFLGGDEIVVLDFPFLRDQGFFEATWMLVDGPTDVPISCDEAQTDGVEILATLVGPNDGFADIFDCDADYGMTAPLLVGTYEVVLYLLDDELVIDDIDGGTVSLEWGNQIKDLGDFVFEVWD